MRRQLRQILLLSLISILLGGLASTVRANEVLVLPLRTLGVSDTTANVVREVLMHELRARGMAVMGTRSIESVLPRAGAGCDEGPCARDLGRIHGAERVVYGSLSKLGGKILVSLYLQSVESPTAEYADRFSTISVDELDRVMVRAAEGITAGRANSDPATVDSVILDETYAPERRATRRGFGLRGGFIFPTGDSYAGADRLTSLRFVYKYEGREFFFETTTLLGLAWGESNVEWTPLDIFAAKIYGIGDMSAYIGAGAGIRSVHLERQVASENPDQYWPEYRSQGATTMSFDLGAGLMAMRTYDVNIVIDLRYHYVAEDFNQVDGNGAHGLTLTFGAGR